MPRSPARASADPQQRLDEIRPAFERLKAERIRAEGDIERLTRELDEARRLAREAFGTDDEDKIRRMIAAQEAENAAAVTAFAALVQNIDARLSRLADDA